MFAAALAALLSAAGCIGGGLDLSVGLRPLASAPVADPRIAAVSRLRQAWSRRDTSLYRTLFTSDFSFGFAPGDTTGARFGADGWGRDDEIGAARRMFALGCGVAPAFRAADLNWTSTLVSVPDDRPGRASRWHQRVDTGFALRAYIDNVVWDVGDVVTFFLTRGDSARLEGVPGATPDSTRWYVDRWEERESAGGSLVSLRAVSPAQTLPSGRRYWGELKVLYLTH